ncbi:hypothetical protein T09_15 [Trichinella sp. T9]|nr:hypothetical protein T09_15 [Trichinella sp. T9]
MPQNVQRFIFTSINLVPKCNHFEFYISSSDRSLFLHICITTTPSQGGGSGDRLLYMNAIEQFLILIALSIVVWRYRNKLVHIIRIEVVMIAFLSDLSLVLFNNKCKKQLLFAWHQYFPNVASQSSQWITSSPSKKYQVPPDDAPRQNYMSQSKYVNAIEKYKVVGDAAF